MGSGSSSWSAHRRAGGAGRLVRRRRSHRLPPSLRHGVCGVRAAQVSSAASAERAGWGRPLGVHAAMVRATCWDAAWPRGGDVVAGGPSVALVAMSGRCRWQPCCARSERPGRYRPLPRSVGLGRAVWRAGWFHQPDASRDDVELRRPMPHRSACDATAGLPSYAVSHDLERRRVLVAWLGWGTEGDTGATSALLGGDPTGLTRVARPLGRTSAGRAGSGRGHQPDLAAACQLTPAGVWACGHGPKGAVGQHVTNWRCRIGPCECRRLIQGGAIARRSLATSCANAGPLGSRPSLGSRWPMAFGAVAPGRPRPVPPRAHGGST